MCVDKKPDPEATLTTKLEEITSDAIRYQLFQHFFSQYWLFCGHEGTMKTNEKQMTGR